MADKNTNRDNQAAVADEDPFAELARIMNRGAQGDVSTPDDANDEPDVPADADSVDLERELLGDLDDGYPDHAVASGDAFADEPEVVAETFGDEQGGIAAGDDDLGDDADYRHAAEDAGMEEVPAPAQEEWVPAYASQPDEAASATREWDNAQPANEVPANNWQPDFADDPADVPASGDDGVLADVDMDFGDLDAPGDAAPDSRADMPVHATDEAEQPTDAHESVSLEDELEMMLTAGPAAGLAAADGESFESADGEAGDWGEPSQPGFPEPAQPPQSAIFGRANFTGDDSEVARDAELAEAGFDQPEIGNLADGGDMDAEAPEASEVADPFAALSSLGHDATAVDIETVDVPEPSLAQHDDLELPDLPEDVPPGPAPEDDFDGQFAYDIPAHLSPREQPDQLNAATHGADSAAGDDDDFYSEALGFETARDAGQDQVDSDSFDADMRRDLDEAMDLPGAPAGETAAEPNRRSGLIVAGAVLGIALLGGIGAFALSFGGGDDSATPVLVQADDEPMKVKPDDPGGVSTVPNQDSVAYEAAAGGAERLPRQESLVNADEEPVNIASRTIDTNRLPGIDDELAEPGDGASGKAEDRLAANSPEARQEVSNDIIAVQPRRVRTMIVRPDGTLVPREDETPAAETETAPAGTAAAADSAADTLLVAEPAAVPETAETAAAEAEEPASLPGIPMAAAEDEPAVEPVEEIEEAAPPATETAAAQPEDPVTPRVGPVAESRPANQGADQPRQVAQAAPAATRTQPAAPAAAVATSSEWSMQIASQPSAESAQATYQELARRYGDLLGGRGVNIVRAEIPGKGTYYRVRIPTSSRNDGVTLCERYKALGGSCFVSK